MHVTTCTYVNDHADSRQRGCQVLRVRRPDVYRNTSSIETAVKSSNQIDPWGKTNRGKSFHNNDEMMTEGTLRHGAGGRTHQEDRAALHSLLCWCCLSQWALQLSSQLAYEAGHRSLSPLSHPEGQVTVRLLCIVFVNHIDDVRHFAVYGQISLVPWR